jgi:hypothetical protein
MAPPTHRALAARQSRGPQAVAKAYVFAERRVRRVGIDYHVEVERHFYSVSYRFARREVEVRIAGRTCGDHRKGRADRRGHAIERQRQAHHRRRLNAIKPSRLRRLDRRPYP